MRSLLVLLFLVPCLALGSELASLIERYQADRGSLSRTYPIQLSLTREKKMEVLYRSYLAELGKLRFDSLSHVAQVDHILLQGHLEHELRDLKIQAEYRAQIQPLIPFAGQLIEMEEARRRMEPLDGAKAADRLIALAKAVGDARAATNAKLDRKELAITNGVEPAPAGAKESLTRSAADRAAGAVGQLARHLADWNRFYEGYDPMYTWWCAEPFKVAAKALDDYTLWIRERLVGIRPDDRTTIIGFPIGRDALIAELLSERIPYTPEELIEKANAEFAWCEAEMKKASQAMGFGNDWKKALEKVKTLHVEPGKQPALIRELALEAIEFIERRDLVTVPELCKETWRMEMLSPQQQLQSPFFLGGEVIQVAFPTSGMSHEAKQMSMRGNNKYFSRATVQHELIPGHHLQGFMVDRYSTQRGLFRTPFWTEGWALYWELLLWDLGFPKSPEEKVGMLFWRMHRCARIIFSLGFHLGKMTPQQCVDFLVDRVGHERDNAAAEVRRSFAGNYGPLYQAAYLLGGMQIMSLHKELVETKKMTNRQFHDSILQGGSIPIEMVRAGLTRQKLTPGMKPSWRF